MYSVLSLALTLGGSNRQTPSITKSPLRLPPIGLTRSLFGVFASSIVASDPVSTVDSEETDLLQFKEL